MTGVLAMVAMLAVMGVLASCFGADTRDGQDWRQRPGQWRPPSHPARRAGALRARRAVGRPMDASRPGTVRGAA